jgi:hypothetical protein
MARTTSFADFCTILLLVQGFTNLKKAPADQKDIFKHVLGMKRFEIADLVDKAPAGTFRATAHTLTQKGARFDNNVVMDVWPQLLVEVGTDEQARSTLLFPAGLQIVYATEDEVIWHTISLEDRDMLATTPVQGMLMWLQVDPADTSDEVSCSSSVCACRHRSNLQLPRHVRCITSTAAAFCSTLSAIIACSLCCLTGCHIRLSGLPAMLSCLASCAMQPGQVLRFPMMLEVIGVMRARLGEKELVPKLVCELLLGANAAAAIQGLEEVYVPTRAPEDGDAGLCFVVSTPQLESELTAALKTISDPLDGEWSPAWLLFDCVS